MNLNLLTYADQLYAPMQAKLVEHAQSLNQFDYIIYRNRNHLVQTDFYKYNRRILDHPKGGGYCLWKPMYIIDTLSRMDEGDVLIYMDSADWIENGETLREEVLELMKDKNLLLTDGSYPNKNWTRRDTFHYMECDEPKYWNGVQLEAGIIVVKNTDFTRKILLEWQKWCKVPDIIMEVMNTSGLPNLDGYMEHRYDQSVLTNLKYKYDLYSSGEMRKFIHCNVNMPEIHE
jgi:hypothetical protein